MAAPIFAQLKAKISDKVQLDDALELLADQFIRSRDQNVAGCLLDATRPVPGGSLYQRQEFLPWRIANDGDELIVLISAGGDLDFPPTDRAALERAMSGEPFSAAEIPA